MDRPSPSDYSALDQPEVVMHLFHPRKAAGPVDGNGRFQELLIPVADGVRVGGRFYAPHPNGPSLLFFHGNGEIVADYDPIAPHINQLGINFMAVDYRGYGCSEGTPTVSAMMADCHRILGYTEQWRRENRFSGPLVVMGRSLGSASALELAATCQDRIDGLIVESGFAWAGPLLRLLGVDPERIGLKRSQGFENVDKIRQVTKPTLIIHAEFDHVIAFEEGQALYDACGAAEKVLVKIPGANHNDIFMHHLDHYLDAIARMTHNLPQAHTQATRQGR